MKIEPSIRRIVTELGELAHLLGNAGGSAADYDRYLELQDRVMRMVPEHEAAILGLVMAALGKAGDYEASAWLFNELEVESSLQYLPIPGSARERACVSFAIPVVVPTGEQLSRTLCDDEGFELLHDVLREASIIGDTADFRLVPRLFTHRELFSRSYGQVAELTRHLGRQLLAGERTLDVPAGFAPLSNKPGTSPTPWCEVYYLLGVLSTPDSELENAFPDLAEAFDENGDQDGTPGFMDDGTPWEKAFLLGFEIAFGGVLGPDTTCAPAGFHDDLRRGGEVAREVGLIRSMGGIPEGAEVLVRLSPLYEPDEGQAYITVTWVDAHSGEALDAFDWPVLAREDLEAAVDRLMQALEDIGLEPEDPELAASTEISSFLLH